LDNTSVSKSMSFKHCSKNKYSSVKTSENHARSMATELSTRNYWSTHKKRSANVNEALSHSLAKIARKCSFAIAMEPTADLIKSQHISDNLAIDEDLGKVSFHGTRLVLSNRLLRTWTPTVGDIFPSRREAEFFLKEWAWIRHFSARVRSSSDRACKSFLFLK
jgi:hypothetical protein